MAYLAAFAVAPLGPFALARVGRAGAVGVVVFVGLLTFSFGLGAAVPATRWLGRAALAVVLAAGGGCAPRRSGVDSGVFVGLRWVVLGRVARPRGGLLRTARSVLLRAMATVAGDVGEASSLGITGSHASQVHGSPLLAILPRAATVSVVQRLWCHMVQDEHRTEL